MKSNAFTLRLVTFSPSLSVGGAFTELIHPHILEQETVERGVQPRVAFSPYLKFASWKGL